METFRSVVPKVGVNYPPGVISDSSSGGNAKPRNTTLFCTMSDHCEMLGVIRHDRYFDLGNGLKNFGKHVFR